MLLYFGFYLVYVFFKVFVWFGGIVVYLIDYGRIKFFCLFCLEWKKNDIVVFYLFRRYYSLDIRSSYCYFLMVWGDIYIKVNKKMIDERLYK